ncbi:hypothetical protein SC431_12290 [Legionella pneumophila serogroup 1]|uniref:hypothetical protein n=1 Tax=Legionella pneumophila TaxID=446 RepID=UPI0005C9A5F1|nr:hypothetical protein [Legionella pneumophila]HAT8828290.1 hypothetical protein [Legionella pneumophila subsp. pneumophila]WAI79397.1 hypothetical protein OXA86_00845 [Legionella pneumophila]HAT4693300.1 hypothetical protein [Legionella pneumophila]HAT9531338.1 hypothetical protein [Legionella pneumophila subsp. pneumophila]HAU0767031.1 hypothetical protein [Legionella pneumophila]
MNNQIKYTQEQLDKALIEQSNDLLTKVLEKSNHLLRKVEKFELDILAQCRMTRRLLQGLCVVVIIGIVCGVI